MLFHLKLVHEVSPLAIGLFEVSLFEVSSLTIGSYEVSLFEVSS